MVCGGYDDRLLLRPGCHIWRPKEAFEAESKFEEIGPDIPFKKFSHFRVIVVH